MRTIKVSIFLSLSVCASFLARADDGLFISFYNTGQVGLYNGQTGALLNSTFASVQDALGLALGPNNSLYVGSDSLPSAFGAAGIVSFGINGATGTPQGTFADHTSDNSLNNPQGLAFSGGNLYVGDITAGAVFVYNSLGVHTATISGNSSLFLSAPSGLHFDASLNLYIADEDQGDVYKYSGGVLTRVNSQPGTFDAARDVVVGPDGNLYVLNISGATGGIYELNLSDGSDHKIVDYSTSSFQPSNLLLGSDGKLYVSGVDLDSNDGEVLDYNLDGSGGAQFIDTGTGTSPGFMVENTPEPSVWSLAGLAAGVLALAKFRRSKPASGSRAGM